MFWMGAILYSSRCMRCGDFRMRGEEKEEFFVIRVNVGKIFLGWVGVVGGIFVDWIIFVLKGSCKDLEKKIYVRF